MIYGCSTHMNPLELQLPAQYLHSIKPAKNSNMMYGEVTTELPSLIEELMELDDCQRRENHSYLGTVQMLNWMTQHP